MFMRAAVVVASTFGIAVPALAAAEHSNWPNYQESDFIVENYQFASGETLPQLKLHCRTIGTAQRNAAGEIVNGVLLLQGNTGTGANWLRPVSRASFRITGTTTWSTQLYDERVARVAKGDANDSLWAIESIEDYSPEADLPKIKAKVLLINMVEDVANPPELDTVERAMKRIHQGRYVLIPYSAKMHGHFTHYYAAVWKPYLIDFMETLGPATAAAR